MKVAVVLAAGRGTRLRPLTLQRSKAMQPVVGRPMVERVLEVLSAGGIERFILVRAASDETLERHFQEHPLYRERVELVVQPEPGGSAQALSCAAPLLEGDFLLSACDNLVEAEDVRCLLAAWTAGRQEALLTTLRVPLEAAGSTALISIEGGLVRRIVEKPGPGEVFSDLASLPLYALSPRILELLKHTPLSPRGEYELSTTLQLLIERGGRVRPLPVGGRMTLTTPGDLLALNRHFLRRGLGATAGAPAGVEVIPPCRIEPEVQVGQGAVIGPEVYLEAGSRVGAGAAVHRSLVLRGGAVPPGARVEDEVVTGT